MLEIMARFQAGINELAGYRVGKIEDYSVGLNGLPKSDVIKFYLDCGTIVVRPSGTEPKLKIYVSVTAKNENDSQVIEKDIVGALEKYIR